MSRGTLQNLADAASEARQKSVYIFRWYLVLGLCYSSLSHALCSICFGWRLCANLVEGSLKMAKMMTWRVGATMRIYLHIDIDIHRHIKEGMSFEPETVDTFRILRFWEAG